MELRWLGAYFLIRISKTNLKTLVSYLQSCPQPTCFLFYLERATDRQVDLLPLVLRSPAFQTGLEPLHIPQR